MRFLLSSAAALFIVLALAGCGGGHKSAAGTGLVSGGGSAGQSADYKPSGNLVADNGFRPDPNGFSWENYGNDVGPQNMTATNMDDLFGDVVCARGSGSSCQLTPTAQKWMDVENERMAGGHCMGFSVTALRFYAGNLPLSPFGGNAAFALPLRGNVDLQSLIAEDWVFQDLPTVQGKKVTGAPSDVLKALVDSLNSGSGSNRSSAYPSFAELYTLVIFKADGTGGHAITPYAVEEKGGGLYTILVYDNNFPGVTRPVEVDTNADTWKYVGGTNPSATNELYTGDASTQNLMLYPTAPGIGTQPCPFCNGEGAAGGASAGSALPRSQQYYEITLTGDPKNHAHLILSDEQNRITGFYHGKFINQIPGAQIVQTLSSQTWNAAPEPAYRIPTDTIVGVLIDASDLTKPDKESITLIGPGLYAGIEDIALRPNDRDVIAFGGGGKGFVYRTTEGRVSTPGLALGLEENGVGYAMAVAAAGTKGGSQIAVYTHPDGTLTFDTGGTKGSAYKGFAIYVVEIQRITKSGNAVWSTAKIVLKKGWKASIDYRHAVAGKTITVLSGPPGHLTYKQKLPAGNNLPS